MKNWHLVDFFLHENGHGKWKIENLSDVSPFW
jgi:hypothetical protein